MRDEQVVVVIPAYNEAKGLPEFLHEIHRELTPFSKTVQIIVVDDASTDQTCQSVLDIEGVQVLQQIQNRGHGPSAQIAYRAGLATGADVIVHVDGDGQFLGADMARVILALRSTKADVVHGVRRGRSDPWYRRALSALLRTAALAIASRPIPDLNTPLRAYRPEALARLLDHLPADALVPHVHFSIAEVRSQMIVRYVGVESLPRRGGNAEGTMWGSAKRARLVPPIRLIRFVGAASSELWRLSMRRHSKTGVKYHHSG